MIMAGGVGSRLWPLSRKSSPKQLLPIFNGKTLLEEAANRLDGIVPLEKRLICSGENFKKTILKALPNFSERQYLGEPEGRDTMNAVGLTAAVISIKDPNAVFAVLTADHVIRPQHVIKEAIKTGFEIVEEDSNSFVTFGIKPTSPSTGYGYIERGSLHKTNSNVFFAKRFVEKPNKEKALSYLEQGTFDWNSGMFIFQAEKLLETIKKYHPDTYSGLLEIQKKWDSPDKKKTLKEVYPRLKKVSIDYGIMEPLSQEKNEDSIVNIPVGVEWLDIGSWSSYSELMERDHLGNSSNARFESINSRGICAVSDNKEHLITTIDCEDLVIVNTKSASLVCPLKSVQKVKDLVQIINSSDQ